MKEISLSGSGYEIGYGHGAALKNLVIAHMGRVNQASAWVYLHEKRWILDRFTHYLRDNFPWLLEEIKGLAEATKFKYLDMLYLIFSVHELGREPPTFGCSVFGAKDPATLTGETLAGKTEDMDPSKMPLGFMMRVKPNNGYGFVAHTYAGEIGVGCGVNTEGLCTGIASVPRPNDADLMVGLSRIFAPRLVLQLCGSVDEAVDLLARHELGFSGINMILADRSNVVIVEKSPSHQAVIPAVDGVVFRDNRFMHPSMIGYDTPRGYSGPYPECRWKRFSELFEEHRGKVDLEVMKAILSDHKYGLEHSICNHVTGLEGQMSHATLMAAVMQPSRKTIYITDGNPCENAFVPYQP